MQAKKGALTAPSDSTLTIAVASGKGGVGKTNIAANLAICLAKQSFRTLLIDADLGLANVDVLLNLRSRHHLGHFLSGQKQWHDIIHPGPDGVDVLCGGSGIAELANLNAFERQRLIEVARQASGRWGCVMWDAGAGIQASVVDFCLSADIALVVTTPEPTAMTDAYALIKVLTGSGYAGRIYLLVNMAQTPIEARGVYRQISDVASRFLGAAVYDGGFVSKDPCVCLAVKRRAAVVQAYPKCPAAQDLFRLAARLTHSRHSSGAQTGIFKKVANWFF